jgi:mannose-6-phosphate isomerase-like protein (cupin superfamily)
MLSDTLFRVRRVEGLQTLQRRGEQGARELTTHRMTLPAGGSGKFVSAEEETVVVLIEGRGQFDAGDHSWSVQRGFCYRLQSN